MMRKKHSLQNNNLIKAKKEAKAKVTVQYIQNPQLFQNSNCSNNDHTMVNGVQEDLEIENVEYLEENTNVDEYVEGESEKDELEDNFYPNAIYCLLDLYKTKFESLITKNEDFKADEIWHSIATNMQESYFDFSERQIQHKYASLREQYFLVETKEDIENFEYFEQLHDIYRDPNKQNIINGQNSVKTVCVRYKDELFLQPEHLESNPRILHDFKSEEIVHKEHEFIDMVEKELQAIEDGVAVADKQTIENEVNLNEKKLQDIELKSLNIEQQSTRNKKRVHLDSGSYEEPPQRKPKLNENFNPSGVVEDTCTTGNKSSNNFSLLLYNQEQERRHREKMSLLEKSLKIQERAIEQQHQLLQELINRLAS